MLTFGLLLLAGSITWLGCESPSSSVPSSTTTYVSPNPDSGGQFGASVASVGDVNGDGRADVLIGAPDEDVEGKPEAGRAYLFSGSDRTLLRTITAPTLSAEGGFGGIVASLGDTNGDGIPDLVIGASGADGRGQVYLIGGADGEVLYTITSPNPKSNGFFGVSSFARVEDVNEDSVAEMLIGAFGENRAYLFSGATGQVLQTLTSSKGGGFGGAAADVGDVNGDGISDLLVGATAEPVDGIEWAGGAHLFSGATGERLRSITSPNAQTKGLFGYSVASIGDADGDETSDYAIFARFENGGGPKRAGRVYLYSGATGEVLRTLNSPNAEQRGLFGYSLAGIGDVTGDGRADLALAARKESVASASEAGRIYVIDGATGDSLHTMSSPNAEEKGQLGYSLAVVRDAETDAATALLAGAYKESVDSLELAGRVYRFRLE